MTRKDFYDCRLVEIAYFLNAYFEQKREESKERWVIARFQMGAMTNVSKVRFPWEKVVKKTASSEEKQKLKRVSDAMDEIAMKNFTK